MVSTDAERRNTSRNGKAANAALSGFGWRARLAARRKSPEPRYSGTNHRIASTSPLPTTSTTVFTRRSIAIRYSP